MKRIMLCSAILFLLFTTGCSSNQGKQENKAILYKDNQTMEDLIHDTIIEHSSNQENPNNHALVYVEAHKTLRIVEKEKKVIAYLQVLCESFQQDLAVYSGYQAPIRLTFSQNKNKLELEEFWFPKDGTLYEPSIREVFPSDLVKEAMNLEFYDEKVAQQRKEQARALFEKK